MQMDARDAAQLLLRELKAPAWALSVSVTLEGETVRLIVRVDPNYRAPLTIPDQYEGFPVERQWRSPTRAYNSN
jgi:hypothetical protein